MRASHQFDLTPKHRSGNVSRIELILQDGLNTGLGESEAINGVG